MITDLTIYDYQSINRARISLGRLTVVTGPTGSGKSGVIRALRLVAFNARGTSYIRHGVKTCRVAIGLRDENRVAVIHRGARGSDKYVLGAMGDDGSPVVAEEYTKLAGSVPAEVTEVLGLTDLNFAGQFDRPFLLDASGSQVARVLGELTNVSIVFEAAREATRRKGETARDLKRAEAELESLTEQAGKFRTLKERRRAAAEARELIAGMTVTTIRLGRLAVLYSSWDHASGLVGDLEMGLAETELPSAELLQSKWERLARLRDLREDIEYQLDQVARAQGRRQFEEDEESRLHGELHALLAEAGVCPTCGRQVAA